MKNSRIFAWSGAGFVFAAALVITGCASTSPAPVVERGGQPPSVYAPSAAKDTYTVKGGDTLYSIARDHGMDHRELIALNGIENPNQISVGRVLKVKSQNATTSAVASTAPVTTDVVVARPIGGEPAIEKRPLGANTETMKREPKGGKEPYSDQALAQAQGQAKPAEPVAPPVKTEVSVEAKPADTALNDSEIAWVWPANGKIIGVFGDAGKKGMDIAGKAGDPVMAASDGKISYTGTGLPAYGKLVVIKHNSAYMSVYAHNQAILVKEGQIVTKGQKIAEMGNTGADQVKLHFEIRHQPKPTDTVRPVDPLQYLPKR